MTPADSTRVLALIQTFDNRKVDLLTSASWHSLIGHLDFDDACEAVRRYFTCSREWLMPTDIIAGVKRIRADRLERTPDAVPDADPDDPAAYQQALREGRTRTADGLAPRDMSALPRTFPSPPTEPRPLAITRGPARTPLAHLPVVDPERLAQARAELDQLRETSAT